jgi:hypothetical protein
MGFCRMAFSRCYMKLWEPGFDDRLGGFAGACETFRLTKVLGVKGFIWKSFDRK